MNNIKKLTAAVLAVAMLAVFAGCGDQSWSYRTSSVSLSAGTYIYNLLNGYYEAYDLVDTPDEAKDILQEVVEDTDKDTGKKTVEQYALDTADDTTSKMVAVEDLFKKYNLELDQEDYDAAKTYTSQIWNNMKKTLEGYGIGESSFDYCYAEYTVKYSQVFKYLYGKDGDNYVTDEELIDFYKDKYTGYAYFSLGLVEYDDDGNPIAASDDEIAEADSKFSSYADMINKDKKDYKEVILQYAEDYDYSSDPTYSGSYNKDESSLSDDISAALDGLKEGEATYFMSGDAESAVYYFVYKPVTDDIIDFLDDEDESDEDIAEVETEDEAADSVYVYDLKTGYSHYSLLTEMKGDDYDEYLENHAKSLNIEKNKAVINEFKPKMFVD